MGRPQKSGVVFFGHDTGARNKRTLSALRYHFGNDGYAFWFILLEILGEQSDLMLDCNDESNWIYLYSETMVDSARADEILSLLARVNAIDKQLWQEKRIIWVQNFVDRLEDVFKKRRTSAPIKPAVVSSENENKEVFGAKSTGEVEFSERKLPQNEVCGAESTQSKVKESKVESKVKSKVKIVTTNSSVEYSKQTLSEEQVNQMQREAFDYFVEKTGNTNTKNYDKISALVNEVGLEIFKLAIDKGVNKKGSRVVRWEYFAATAKGIKADCEKGDVILGKTNGINHETQSSETSIDLGEHL